MTAARQGACAINVIMSAGCDCTAGDILWLSVI